MVCQFRIQHVEDEIDNSSFRNGIETYTIFETLISVAHKIF